MKTLVAFYSVDSDTQLKELDYTALRARKKVPTDTVANLLDAFDAKDVYLFDIEAKCLDCVETEEHLAQIRQGNATIVVVKRAAPAAAAAPGGLNNEQMIRTILDNTNTVKLMVGHLFSSRVRGYMDPSSTHTTTMGQETFRSVVTEYYGYADGRNTPQLCMLTNRVHDWHDLVAGHIVPRAQARDAKFDLKIDDINDPRNGVFWSRAVEGAWTAGVFCFSYPAPGVFRFKLLNQAYAAKRIQDWPLKPPLKNVTIKALGDLTWGDLHTSGELHFLPGQYNRPYSRALCFMAKMALMNSRMESWDRPEDIDSAAGEFEYMSDDGKVASTIAWVQGLCDDLRAPDQQL